MRRGKISPSKIANTGVNPYTGEYLSAGERKLLFQKRNVSSANVFKKSVTLVKRTPSTITPNDNISRKSGALVKTKSSDENIVKSLEKRFSVLEKTVYSISKALDNKSDNKILSKRVSILENDVSFLAKALNKEADLEKKAQKQYEKDVGKVEEKKLRSGEEKKLEKKITKGLISPVKAVGKKAGGVLGNLVEVFMTLLGGWLTNQGLEAIKANAEGDINKLESIKNEVIKTLAIVGGIFALLNGGILGIIGTIGAITAAIIAAPFKFAFNRIRALSKARSKPPTTKPPTTTPSTTKLPKPGSLRGGGSPQIPRPGAGASGLLGPNGKPLMKSPLDAYKGAGSSPARAPQIPEPKPTPKPSAFKILKQLLTSGKSKVLNGVKSILKSPAFGSFLGSALKIAFVASTIKNRLDQGYSPIKAIAPIIPEILITLKGTAIGGGLAGTLGLVTGPGAFLVGALGAVGGGYLGGLIGQQFTRMLDPAYDALNLDSMFKFANDPISEALQNSGLMPKTKKSPSPGEMPAKTPGASVPAATGSSPAANTSGGTDSNPSLVKPTAQVSSPSSPSMSVPGPVSGGGNTTVIYKKVGGSGGQMQGQPLKSGSATDVPLIASADPSNFYTMYSQLLYNVVG